MRATKLRSLDHLVGGREQRRWHGQAEHLGSLEIDNQLVFGRRLHRKIGRFLALENAVDVAGRAPELVVDIGAEGNQTAADDEVTGEVDRGQSVSGRPRDDQIAMNAGQSASRYDQAAIRSAREGRD